jgi:eukaryotic-like serine/threonine-protein kinase
VLRKGDRLTVVLELESLLGEGGMGRTFLARDLDLKHRVVVKTLRPGLSSTARLVRRFAREARILATLDHPNIVKLLTGHVAGTDPWFAMEYCEGGDLNSARGSRSESWQNVLELVAQASEGVAFAHAHEGVVIHRDIKPSNILVTADGRAKVADFGLAYLRKRDSTSLTSSDQALGTIDFMAPEQMTGAKHVGPPADVYSLAATLLFVLSGQGTDDLRRSGQLRNPRIPQGVRRRLCALLASALSREPTQRISLVEFKGQLRGMSDDVGH